MTLSKKPAYNLKAVLQETGIGADTLRAWERRYGLPLPQRTVSGHRLYSRNDIETVKWLMARQMEGLSISRAVDSWNNASATGADPLEGPAHPISSSGPVLRAARPPETSLESLRSRWLTACLSFKQEEAEQVLNQALAIHPIEACCIELLQYGLREIGAAWYENHASVQQEHFASDLALRRFDSLISASPAPTRNGSILIGCPANEWHTFPQLLLSLLLRRRGWNVIHLGANVPSLSFEQTVSSIHADLVILAAQTLTSAASLQFTALALAKLGVPVGFGGRIFNLRANLKEYIPGHHLGDTIESSLPTVEWLMKGGTKPGPYKTASREHLEALQAFIACRSHIEATIKESIQALPISPEGLRTGIHFMGENIAAALQLGDLQHVTGEVEWLKVLLQVHERPPQELATFLETYSQALDKHINGRGDPIKAWLKEQALANN